MDENILKAMNEELLELRQMRRMAERRLAEDRIELQKTKEMREGNSNHSLEKKIPLAGKTTTQGNLGMTAFSYINSFEVLFRNMQAREERLIRELENLKK